VPSQRQIKTKNRIEAAKNQTGTREIFSADFADYADSERKTKAF
jgi:hypothetical protein